MNKHSIFIFTNNDSMKLGKILSELSIVKKYYNIHVIDDSHHMDMIKKNFKSTSKFGKNSYLGKEAFTNFYNSNNIIGKSLEDVIGTENWNLGTARNFALDYSIIKNYEKVLFIDDDISGIEFNNLDLGFKTLTINNFVSCNIKGRPDDSIVGHLAKQLNVVDEDPRMLSGGFLFLSPGALNNRFYNIYNEDWILQILESNKQRIILPFSVIHGKNELSSLNENVIYFQEIGEIMVEGLLLDREALKLESNFWNDVVKSRSTFIQELIANAEHLRKTEEIKILYDLNEWLNQFTGETFLNLLNKKRHERTTY